MDEQPHSSAQKLIKSWQQPAQDSSVTPDFGPLDVTVGGALFGVIAGGFWGILLGLQNGGALVIGFAGVVAGAIGCALIGLLVGLVGQWLAQRLGLARVVRPGVGSRLRHSGLVGLLGGPLFHILLRGFGFGISGFVSNAIIGALLWMVCGVIGAGVASAFKRQ